MNRKDMTQPKNIQFTRLIKAGGRLREFNFRKSQGLNNALFSIDVVSDNSDRHYLLYSLVNGTWILETKRVIPWIEEVLPQVEEAIRDYR